MVRLPKNIIQKAEQSPARVVLAEGNDERVVAAAIAAENLKIADITLLGDKDEIASLLGAHHAESNIKIINPNHDPRRHSYIQHYQDIRGSQLKEPEEAQVTISDPLGFAAMMVRTGDADGTIAGAVATTADTIKAALRIIGKASTTNIVSSFFLMAPRDQAGPIKDRVVFADCALIVEPNENELAEIALQSAQSAMAFLDEKPRVAMLSFSTNGSAEHPRAAMVQKATWIAKRQWPELEIEGEIQFDAAIDLTIKARKFANSQLQTLPNVFVFPSLEAANIGYKIAQRIGGMRAVGPILQGLAKPANDLSRGCSTDDILSLIAVTSIQAAGQVNAGLH